MWRRYPILRILGVACFLAAWATAAFLKGYPNRYTALGGFLAGKCLGCISHYDSQRPNAFWQ